ncbi:MAG: GNAT family N-acetyltransferase [Alphaproteobacteria bacterium]|nr:GNAT family N-acetyltransferase [Alphaproteobacteria bacterium]
MITYRRPELIEAEAFAALHVQCWREAYAGIVPLALLESFTPQQRIPHWHRWIADKNLLIVAAYDGEKAIGFVTAGKPDELLHDGMDGQIYGFYIAASYHRLGIGRNLLNKIKNIWMENGGHALTLGVLAKNTRARRFYEAMGGKLVRTGIYDWSGFKLADAIYLFEGLER